MKRVLVAAGLIKGSVNTDKADLFLVSRRRSGTHLAGFWEFPGGKIEAGESPEQALIREVHEELGVRVEVGDIYAVGHHNYESREVFLLVYEARLIEGVPECKEVAELRWVSVSELLELELPPADEPVLRRLRRG